MKKYTLLALLPFLPLVAHAQNSFQKLFAGTLLVINSTIIPFLFGLAFVFFAINVIRYFVVGAGNKDTQENAKNVALYSVAAFVFLIIFWGIVEMLAESTGLEGCTQVTSDYVMKDFVGPPLPFCP